MSSQHALTVATGVEESSWTGGHHGKKQSCNPWEIPGLFWCDSVWSFFSSASTESYLLKRRPKYNSGDLTLVLPAQMTNLTCWFPISF